MSFVAANDAIYGKDYTYREARFKALGTKLAGYDFELYDGTDEADPFRVESTREMRDKAENNQLLPEGCLRAGANVPDALPRIKEEGNEKAEERSDSASTVRAAPSTGRYLPPHRRSRGRNVVARKLDLHAILTDGSIQKKYKFAPVSVAELRAVREEDPGYAAHLAQQMLQAQGFEQTSVVTGTVQQFTKTEAVNELAYLAATEGKPSCTVDAKVSSTSVAGDNLHFLVGQHSMESFFDHEWELICPIARAKSGLDYCKLLMAIGYEETFARAGIAAAVLGISIVHMDPRPILRHPSVESHAAGPDSPGFDLRGFDEVTTVSRGHCELVKAVRPVLQGQHHSAFTVAIAGSGRLLNEHVRKKATSTRFMGKELRKYQTFRLAGELWFFYDTSEASKGPAGRAIAKTRPPKDGEAVRLVVPHPEDDTLCYVGPAGTISPGYDGAWCVDAGSVAFAQHGMSGLPLVAETDGAVVAVHDGIALGRLRVLAIPNNVTCDAYVEQAVSRVLSYTCLGSKSIAHADLDVAKSVKTHRRNITAINEALDFDGDRTLLSCYGSRCYVGGKAGEVCPDGFSYGFTSTGAAGRDAELPLRAPVAGDRVLIIGRSTLGTYCSPVLPMGDLLGDSLFALDLGGSLGAPTGALFNGALVVALDDARVVGFVSTKGIIAFGASNYTVMCWACSDIKKADEPVVANSVFEDAGSDPTTPVSSGMFTFISPGGETRRGPVALHDVRDTLAALLPMVGFHHKDLFPDGELDEVISHPSLYEYELNRDRRFAANRYWARMGDSAMSFLIMRDMRELGIPDAEATVTKSRYQNNARMETIAVSLGLRDLYRYRVGASLSQHNMADLLEAILGWVAEKTGVTSGETISVYKRFAMGVQTGEVT